MLRMYSIDTEALVFMLAVCVSFHVYALKGPLLVYTITNSDLNRPCFAWHTYWKSGLFKTELGRSK